MNNINKVFFLKISSSLHFIFQIYHIEANSMITLYKHIMKRIILCSIRSQSFIWEMLKLPSFYKNELAFQSLFYLSWRFENVTTSHLLNTSPHFPVGTSNNDPKRVWTVSKYKPLVSQCLLDSKGPLPFILQVLRTDISYVTHKDIKWSLAN